MLHNLNNLANLIKKARFSISYAVFGVLALGLTYSVIIYIGYWLKELIPIIRVNNSMLIKFYTPLSKLIAIYMVLLALEYVSKTIIKLLEKFI